MAFDIVRKSILEAQKNSLAYKTCTQREILEYMYHREPMQLVSK